MTSIKFIYFDIGGVLILDFSGNNKWDEMKRDLGFTDEKKSIFDSLWEQYTGRVNLDYDIDDFVEVLKEHSDLIKNDYSMLMDFVNRFEVNPYLSQIVTLSSGQYGLGLLTNMYPRMLEKITERALLPSYEWDAVIDSSIEGFEKPEEAIYLLAENRVTVQPNEILFVDNKEENLEVPRQRGWKTFLYDSSKPEDAARQLAKKLDLEL